MNREYGLYIAGPMNGWEGFNFESFNIAEKLLQEPIPYSNKPTYNPASKGIIDGWGWEDYLRDSLSGLLKSEGIVLLNNWNESAGALCEAIMAKILNMPVSYLDLEKGALIFPDAGMNIVVGGLGFEPHIPVRCSKAVCKPSTDRETLTLMLNAASVVFDIVGSNSASHGGHMEWQSRSPQLHLQKSARHALTALAQLDRYERDPDEKGENPQDHIARTIVRSVMAMCVMDKLTG